MLPLKLDISFLYLKNHLALDKDTIKIAIDKAT